MSISEGLCKKVMYSNTKQVPSSQVPGTMVLDEFVGMYNTL